MSIKDRVASIVAKRNDRQSDEDRTREANLAVLQRFMEETVRPVFDEFAEALIEQGRRAKVTIGRTSASIEVSHNHRKEFAYDVEGHRHAETTMVKGKYWATDDKGGAYWEDPFGSSADDGRTDKVTKDDIADHMLAAYGTALDRPA